MTGTAGTTVRVWVTDVWDVVEMAVAPGQTFGDVKAASLELATGRSLDPTAYTVKYRGAVVLDELETLEDRGVPDRAPMIVLPTRRRPVR